MNNIIVRSPLTARPLRVPGQSLDDAIQKVVEDEGLDAVMAIAFLGVLAAMEWVRGYLALPPRPWIMTGLAVVGGSLAWMKLRRARATVRRLRLARDGERAVAEVLERMRESGYRVFHDIVGPRFNVDHLLVGRHGLYVIETKTRSKPMTGPAEIEYDGESVRVGPFTPDRHPIDQAAALARWITDLVKASAGRDCFVRPVVVYPGWYVKDTFSGTRPPVWVMNPKALPAFIEHDPVRLSHDDIRLISFHLSRYIRTAAALPTQPELRQSARSAYSGVLR